MADSESTHPRSLESCANAAQTHTTGDLTLLHKTTHSNSKLQRPPKPKLKPSNPIEEATKSWLEILPPELLDVEETAKLISSVPRRWVAYPPMVLLPAGSFSHESWQIIQELLAAPLQDELWTRILSGISKKEGKGPLTHLAINSGIPLLAGSVGDESPVPVTTRMMNILRTPSGLITLYGDFGPELSPAIIPTVEDFQEAFWVSTKQNGITQIWAPRYTMFSRGNVKEKARLLDFHRGSDELRESRRWSKDDLRGDVAVDLYAGIGYFVFSYVKMGMGRVLGWELNPWSVEGLRRGAVANGWSVRVVKAGEEWKVGDESITVFEEDNNEAKERFRGIAAGRMGSVRHVNCGFLPTSEGSWEMALGILTGDGWIHLHENVGVNEVEARKREIELMFKNWIGKAGKKAEVMVEHVEFVKTFAPDVWHCVFDLYITNMG
ncbi:tRNA wybutosine-synthesizing protein 2 [Venustampulla echinocandica]|uniref:tRNA wybutosine-synthesizing protein 2 n=1 Tax=Venustampulla echinocandica TaxID=2656787 RepID=A0A370TP11_9HELO|nr:tRNA wybutosine-synthesizing protein 2 [Venustampulla echinocandica]RDL37248.1 tRNA wybutosine-synthesizing protein 2 [Venustampulla echinocandica]